VEMQRGEGNGTIVDIYIGVCVCACAIVQCIRGKCNINKHTHARKHTHKMGSEVMEEIEIYRKMSALYGDNCMKIKLLYIVTGWPMSAVGTHNGQP